MRKPSSRLLQWWRNTDTRLNVLMCMLMFALALVFMSPGLPPARVAAPMGQLLAFEPWHSVYPEADPYFVGGDLILQQLPWRHWMQQELAAWRFPLWASAPLGGSSLLGSYQPGVLYPLNLLWVLMPVGAGLGVIMALKLWLGGLGMWGLLRAMKLHPAAAGLNSLSFMFSAWMVDLLPWQLTNIYLLLPYMAWAAYKWCRQRHRASLVALSLLVAFAVFAGHPEMLFIVGMALGIWAVGTLLTYHWRSWSWQVAGLALSVGLGFALSGIQLLPFLETLGLSHTSASRLANSIPFIRFRFEPDLMLYWVLPRFWSYTPEGLVGGAHSSTEASGYVGLVPIVGLVLMVIAAVQRRLAYRLVVPWALVGLIAWLVTYDDVVGTLIRSLPGFNQNVNSRWIAIIAFSVLVLSAFGWDWLARRCAEYLPPNSRHALERSERLGVQGLVSEGMTHHRSDASALGSRYQVLRIGLVAAGLVLLIEGTAIMLVHTAGLLPQPVLEEKISIWYVVNDSYRLYWAMWSLGVLLAVVGATAIWAGWGGRRLVPLLLGAVLLADLWRLLLPVNGTAPAEHYFPWTSFLRQVKEVVPDTERIVARGEVFPANSALVYGIRDWRAQDALITERAYQAALFLYPDMSKSVWSEYNQFFYKVRAEVAPMLGIRYFIMPIPANPNAGVDPGRPPFTRLAYTEGLGLWRLEGVPGFTYLSDNVEVVAEEQAAAEWMRNITWEQVRGYAALIEGRLEDVASVIRDPAGASPGSTEVLDYQPGYIRVRVEAARPAVLVVAESWYPGWRATVDGGPVAVLRANYLSQGVVVPQGTHVVEFHYTPGSFRYGAIISLVSLGLLLLLALWAWRSGRSDRSTGSSPRREDQPQPIPGEEHEEAGITHADDG